MPDGGATSFEPRKDFPSFEEVIGGRDPDLDHWLDYRRQYNAKAGGLWRVHNGLYDLSKFEHPGGNEWLAMTRGMDITEMFEAHHPDIAIARAILKKYYIKDADWPRESPLTFNENDFYAVLRDRVAKVVKEKGSSPRLLSKFIADTTAASFLALSYFSARKRSIPLALAAGFASGALVVMSHNFSHQGKQLRRFYYELTGGETKAIRIHHALSHHMWVPLAVLFGRS